MKELVCHVTVRPTDTHTEFIWGSTLYCHYSYSVMLYVFFFPACQLSILRLLICYVSVHFIKQTEMRQYERGVVSLFPFATSLI